MSNINNNNNKIKLTPLRLLYFSSFLYLLMRFTSDPSSNVNEYVINLIFILSLVVYLVVLENLNIKMKIRVFMLFLIINCFIITIPLLNTHIYLIFLAFKILLLLIFFSRVNISKNKFINYLNYTYILFFSISIFYWFFIPETAANTRLNNEEFTVHFFSYSYQVLPGFRGSPSGIDTYSGTVLLLNATVKAGQKHRKIIILIALLGIFLSFRLTPIAGLFLVFILSSILRKKYFFILINLTGMVIFILLLSILYITPEYKVMSNIYLSDIAYLITHARSYIWVKQLDIMINDYNIYHYFFGGFNADKFSISLVQLSGASVGRNSVNPHNNYLLLFFRSPILFTYMLLTFYWYAFTKLSREYYLLFTFVLLAAYTNSSLFSLGNPIYLYIFIYFLLINNELTSVHR